MAGVTNINPIIECPPNDPRVEFMYCVLEGLPPARQKRLIVMAALEPVGFLTIQQAHDMLGSLGLEDK